MIMFILGLIIGGSLGFLICLHGAAQFLKREGYVIIDGHLYRKIDKLQ